MNEAKEFYAPNIAAWRAWLKKHHATENGIWLITDKGKSRSFTWSELVDEALCYGWVDGRAGTVSDTQSKIYVSRRKPTSTWSRINKQKVAQLIDEGRMQPAGLAVIEIAKKNGTWDQLNKSDNLEMPKELVALLAQNEAAKAYFEAFPPSSRKLILEWIYSAKTDETKRKRIHETVELAAQNIRAHHYRQPKQK